MAATAGLHTSRARGAHERIAVAFGPPNTVTLANESVRPRTIERDDAHVVPGVRIFRDLESDHVGRGVEVSRLLIERDATGEER
jgi:hypothetical protein